MYEEADESWQGPVAILPAAMAENVTPGGTAWMAARGRLVPLTGRHLPAKFGASEKQPLTYRTSDFQPSLLN